MQADRVAANTQQVKMLGTESLVETALCDFAKNLTKFSEYLGQLPLNPVHEDWAQWLFAANKKKTFRQLLAHRESFKTTVSALAIARHLLYCPESRVAVVRSNKEEGKAFVRMVRALMLSEEYIYLLSQLGYAHEVHQVFAVDNADSLVLAYRKSNHKEGSLDAIGYEQSVTGRHYDLLLFDDFVTIEDRLRPVVRRKKYTYANEFVHNILTLDGLAINLGTFWHKEDSNQRFKEAYADDDELIFEERVYPKGTVFGESEAEIEKFKASKVKGLGLSLYNANYNLIDFVDESLPFADMKYKPFDRKAGRVSAAIDPGYGGDRTAVAIGVVVEGELIVVGHCYEKKIYDIIPEVAALLNHYQVSVIHIEDNADKGATKRQIEGHVRGEVRGFTATTNKQWRIAANLRPEWENIYFDDDLSECGFLSDVREWHEHASRDDAPDALARLVEVCIKESAVAHPSTWG